MLDLYKHLTLAGILYKTVQPITGNQLQLRMNIGPIPNLCCIELPV